MYIHLIDFLLVKQLTIAHEALHSDCNKVGDRANGRMTNLVDEIMVFDPRSCSKCRFSRKIELEIDDTYLRVAKSSFSASAIACSFTIKLNVAILETHYLQ